MCANAMCCAAVGLFFVALSGFLQLCVAAVLVFLASGPSVLNPHGECVLGKSEQAATLCTTINTLSLISICSGLILSVSQGFMSVLCGASCGGGSCVEAMGRGLVTAGWLVTAILTTIFGAKEGKHTDDPSLCFATMALCWAMFVLSFAMAIVATVRMATSCCMPAAGQQSCLMLCAEMLCLAWLIRWLCGGSSKPSPTQGYTLYTPVPGGPPDIHHSRSARQHQATAQYHEHLMHAHVPVTVVHPVSETGSGSFYGRGSGSSALPYAPPVHQGFQPTMASPFGQGMQAMGVPVHPSQQHQQQQYPAIYPPSQQQYPAAASGSGYGHVEASAPPLPPGKH